jgi:hypothetical protein
LPGGPTFGADPQFEDRPKAPHSKTLTEAEEAAVIAFRRHTLLPLDDRLYALQPSIPHLTRSALHRFLQRHGIFGLPGNEGDKPKRQRVGRPTLRADCASNGQRL